MTNKLALDPNCKLNEISYLTYSLIKLSIVTTVKREFLFAIKISKDKVNF